MGKIKLPDEIEKWEKKSLREDIGSEKEHTHTIYVYKNIAIEHEHDCGCDAWNPYVLVDGHPFKLHGDYFHNFDEALGYIKGALKEKKLLDEEPDDDDDEPEEPEFPKAEANDMSKSFVMPTAREMFAEAHALPDMYELAKSREIHKQQMREFFDAQKGIDKKAWKREEKQQKENDATFVNVDENSGKYLKQKAQDAESNKVYSPNKPGSKKVKTPEEEAEDRKNKELVKRANDIRKDRELQEKLDKQDDLVKKFPSKMEGTPMDNKGNIGQLFKEGGGPGAGPIDMSTPEGNVAAQHLEQRGLMSDNPTVDYTDLPQHSGLVSEGEISKIKPTTTRLSGTNTDRIDTSVNAPAQTYTPEEKQALVDAAILANGGNIAPGSIHGTSIIGYDSQGRPLYPANTNADRKFFGKGGFGDAVALWNQRVTENEGIPGYTALPANITPGDLSLAALKELYANWYMNTANAPRIDGAPPQRLNPTDMGQLNLLGGINFESDEDLFDDMGNMNSRTWALLQNGRKWNQTPTRPIKTSNGWLRLTDYDGNNFMRGRSIADPDIGAMYESIKDDPVAVSRMFNSDLTLRQLADLRRKGVFTPQQLNLFTGFSPYSGPSQKSFREIMEERIQKADAEAGIPSGYIGMHPHKAAYRTVWLGYGKDATYPFVLKNALTGEKVCEVSDIPRDERKD